MRKAAPILLLLVLCGAAGAQESAVPSAGAERGRSLEHILDRVLVPEEEGPRTLVLLLDPTESLKNASFADRIERALQRNAKRLGETKIGVAMVGGEGRPLLGPTVDLAAVAKAVGEVQARPGSSFQNIYSDVRRIVSSLSGNSGRKDLLLVTLENGDAEDDVDATAAALARAGVRTFVVTREAFLCDTYWITHPTRPPRGLTLTGGDAAFVEVPWGFLFQNTTTTESIASGFAMYGLSRLAAASGGEVFLYYPQTSGHSCTHFGSCPFCSGDHAPSGRAYQLHRLRALAPSAGSRSEACSAAARDPYFQAVLHAWGRASKAGILGSRPSLRGSRPERRLTGSLAPLGGSLNFSGQASRAERLAQNCGEIAEDLLREIGHADSSGGSARYKAIAEYTRIMLLLTRLNLLYFAAFCRDVGPELLKMEEGGFAPPEVARYRDVMSYIGIGFSPLSLCHGARPFAELFLPGGEETGRELAAFTEEAERYLVRHAHTPFAEALRKSGIARFHLTVRGKYVPPPRQRPRSDEEEDTSTDRPTRAGGSDGGGGTPSSGG